MMMKAAILQAGAGTYADNRQWLRDNATPLFRPVWPVPAGHVALCTVSNGLFMLVLVCPERHDFDYAVELRTTCRKNWFIAPVDKVETVTVSPDIFGPGPAAA